MAMDLRGEELKVGDQVTLTGLVTKANEDSDKITIVTSEPKDKPKRQTSIALRAEHVVKAG